MPSPIGHSMPKSFLVYTPSELTEERGGGGEEEGYIYRERRVCVMYRAGRLTVEASIEPPNHTAYRCMWWVITCVSIGLGCKHSSNNNMTEPTHKISTWHKWHQQCHCSLCTTVTILYSNRQTINYTCECHQSHSANTFVSALLRRLVNIQHTAQHIVSCLPSLAENPKTILSRFKCCERALNMGHLRDSESVRSFSYLELTNRIQPQLDSNIKESWLV